MIVIAISGWKNSGKSTLCRELLKIISETGLKVGYIKRTNENTASPDSTDTGAAAALGFPSLLWGADSLRYESANRNAASADPRALAAAAFPDADIVLLEGGKNLKLPRVWVLGENETPPTDDKITGIFAYYDRFGSGDENDRYGAGDVRRLASRLTGMARQGARSARVYIDNDELPLNEFVADFMAGAVRGMLGSLKNPKGLSGGIKVYVKD
ncbi:molybdopterin-guanine dinucleotide biosynthesis protein MobB [Synergistales bacterium]|nr:molybdopterin-guanine dinucleotide biosynthesis protein MobB [Synergistales bacterium]